MAKAKTKWKDMSGGAKAAVISVAAFDAGMRLWAGRDLAERKKDQVNGPKWLWGAGMSVISSMGVLPAIYLLVGRKRP